MTGAEFIRRTRKLGRRRNVQVRLLLSRGKGSHATLYFGDRFTTVKDRKKEIGSGLLHSMLKDLGLSLNDVE